MKSLIAILLAAGVSYAAAYVIVSNQKTEQLRKEQAAWAAEKAKLEAGIEHAKKRGTPAAQVYQNVTNEVVYARSAEEILEELLKSKVAAGTERNQSLRHIVYNLESLAVMGDAALPAIQTFLNRYEDVDYSTDRQRGNQEGDNTQRGNNGTNGDRRGGNDNQNRGPGGQGGPGGFAGFGGPGNNPFQRTRAELDFTFPPSLRIGLVDVLRQIGSPQAEVILAEMLGTSGRGVEVAYASLRGLELMKPGTYGPTAVNSAKDLLSNPPVIEQPNRLDESSTAYLYTVLEFYKDTSYATIAGANLIGPDGRINRMALDYLNKTLKEGAMPFIYQAYVDQRMTNMADRASLMAISMNYAGPNAQANLMFQDAVNNQATPGGMRAMTIASLAGTGGRGPIQLDTPTDPTVIQSRIALLNQIQTTDERTQRAIEMTKANLAKAQRGEAVETDFRSLFGGGDRGDRGNGERGNNNNRENVGERLTRPQ